MLAQGKYGLIAGAVLVSASASLAAPTAEVPSAVATFDKICLTGGVDAASRLRSLAAGGWQKAPAVTINVPKLGISKAIERNYDFSKPEATEQWNGVVDGRPASVVLAHFPAKRRYPTCAR